jgi:hypothetical protein
MSRMNLDFSRQRWAGESRDLFTGATQWRNEFADDLIWASAYS